ncbi:hypothetical protein D6825_00225 [Candidatus Woesearchaeota archaeon]|nr:MAG: hypothetical protein D6825_00225 [Candidatus Woesearchaeota archaeon]
MGLSRIVRSFVLCSALAGCGSMDYSRRAAREFGLYSAPANAAIAYFGSIGIHEAGHALAAGSAGAKSVSVSVLPERSEGGIMLGSTSFKYDDLSRGELSAINVSGTLAMFLSNVLARESLKAGLVHPYIQPTFQWFALANKAGVYANIIRGLARDSRSDMGKEDVWMSIAGLAISFTYDLYDFLSDDFDRFFGSLFGRSLYGDSSKRPSPYFYADGERSYFGIAFKW